MSTTTAVPVSNQAQTILVPCPECRRMTDSVKCYRLVRFLLFAVIFYVWQVAAYVGCPSCMRKMIGIRCLVNLFTANLLFPIVLLQLGIAFLFTYVRGHSAEVREVLQREQAGGPL